MLIKSLKLKKLLSFNDCAVEIGPLNVLIGPNAVGKTNLIEVIALLQAAPTGLATAILRGGGVRQWLWLGDPVGERMATLECELQLANYDSVVYQLEFSENANGFVILSEQIASSNAAANNGVYLDRAELSSSILSDTESLLSQYKNPRDPTPTTQVGREFSKIRIFREFKTGLQSATRYGISTHITNEALVDGADNLALVLHELDFQGVHDRITSYLRRFCERFEDVKISIGEGLARLYLREAGLVEMLSAIRMSDGTLKFLALLAALFHPSPPPLLCIEEPEIGLHPDALQLIAEALIEASQSTQLIVTTHSEALVDALTDQPESVLVCERD